MIERTLTFKEHVAALVGKTTLQLGFIGRNVAIQSNSIRAKDYKQLAHPALE